MRRILLATDGSINAEDAARFLSRLPHDQRFELTVLTVLEVPYVNLHYPTVEWIQECVDRDRLRARETFGKVKEMFEGANVLLDHVVREGNRGAAIVEVAKEINADLVVMGARGHSTVSRILLGSTSDFVATHAHCSVLVVRPTPNRKAGKPLRIMIGFEDSGPSLAALQEFSEIDWGTDTEVSVVAVVSYMSGVIPTELYDEASARNAVRLAAKDASRQLSQSAPSAVVRVIASEHAGEGLVTFALDHESDLIVLGETARSRLGRVLMGSVSRFVLRHAPCSVWITRNRIIEHKSPPQETQQVKAI